MMTNKQFVVVTNILVGWVERSETQHFRGNRMHRKDILYSLFSILYSLLGFVPQPNLLFIPFTKISATVETLSVEHQVFVGWVERSETQLFPLFLLGFVDGRPNLRAVTF